VELNFPLSEYSDDEVAALQGVTQAEVLQELRGLPRGWSPARVRSMLVLVEQHVNTDIASLPETIIYIIFQQSGAFETKAGRRALSKLVKFSSLAEDVDGKDDDEEEEEEEDLPDLAALKKLRVADLKEILTARGLPTAGLKADLVQRLDESRAPETPEVEEEDEDADVDDAASPCSVERVS
jgi:hypothetical protein